MSVQMRTCGSRAASFSGSSLRTRTCTMSTRGATSAVMMKKGIHPDWYSDARVVCNGVEVMTIAGTKASYNVDIYSGNHPFYLGNKSVMVLDDGQVNKFKKRFSDLEDINEIMIGGGAASKADILAAQASKKPAKGKKK